ncbi:hypothetical protein [Gordonia araii]|nr:hypothetical protein [Gordonia araii]NNG96447.1 hypothetical protein [Gordonia araii NBRC 100433]
MSRIELTINVIDDDNASVTLSCCTPTEEVTTTETSKESGCQCSCC